MIIMSFLFLSLLLAFLLGSLILLVAVMAIYLYITRDEPDLLKNQMKALRKHPSSILDPPSVSLSVVVPAFNEEQRLTSMVNETIEYFDNRLKQNPKFTYEILLVDDGSTDDTAKVARDFSATLGSNRFKLVSQDRNRGKGAAVKLGVLQSSGRHILFADADGATRFADVDKLEEMLERITDQRGMGVVCGSRAHMEKDSIAHRSIFRTILMYCFHFLVWSLCVRGVRDTQCGFKLFSRNAAKLLFLNQHVTRWAFDVDILHIAQHFRVPIAEVAVNWTEIPGSKLSPILASIQMAKDLVMIRLRYLSGSWRMRSVEEGVLKVE